MEITKKKRYKKYSYFRIKVTNFNSCFELYVGKDLQLINDSKKLVNDDFSDTQGYVNTDFINGWALMLLRQNSDIDHIVHECNHMLNAIFIRIGHKHNPENDEIQSYLLGEMAKVVNKCLKWHNKK